MHNPENTPGIKNDYNTFKQQEREVCIDRTENYFEIIPFNNFSNGKTGLGKNR